MNRIETAAPDRSVVALGFFDGVHLGHRDLLAVAKQKAGEEGAALVVATFDRPPLAVLRPEAAPRLLTVNAEKTALLDGLGVDGLYLQPFTPALADTPAEDYILDLKRKLNAAAFVMGENHRFGRGGSGGPATVAALGEAAFAVPTKVVDGRPVSSTRIRSLLAEGEMGAANALLKSRYAITGEVVHGAALGRTLGFPTLNLRFAGEKCLPRFGVYAAEAAVAGETFLAVVNIGLRPTVDGAHESVEAHLIGVQGRDFYGAEASVTPFAFLRGEQRFASVEALRDQVDRDRQNAVLAAKKGV